MEKNLHIISLNVPYPVDYGGVYDLFYKLPALQKLGVNIHLHCFDYGRGQQIELNKFCVSVKYYQRNTGVKGLSLALPYIVSSRKNEALIEDLLKDDYPILMEGVHCTYPAFDDRLMLRKKFVRLHNTEYKYYNSLGANATNLLKKCYYYYESVRLKKYEKQLANRANAFWAVSQKDTEEYRNTFHCSTVNYLPLFLPPWQVSAEPGMGSYCLYHGDLSVTVNEKAVRWLVQHIISKLKIPFVVAGKNPSSSLAKLLKNYSHACLVANPVVQTMQDMIAKAHVNIIPAYNNTGVKIKLLNALYNGRHCLANSMAVAGSGTESLCHITDTPDAMLHRLEQLYHQPFTEGEKEERRQKLSIIFCNSSNAKQMIKWIWGE